MEEEVKAGIEKFREAREQSLPGIKIVIPVRPTAAAFLVSFTFNGTRTYSTILEDDFADWGEATGLPDGLKDTVHNSIQKLTTSASPS